MYLCKMLNLNSNVSLLIQLYYSLYSILHWKYKHIHTNLTRTYSPLYTTSISLLQDHFQCGLINYIYKLFDKSVSGVFVLHLRGIINSITTVH